jgi:hypothetical protein
MPAWYGWNVPIFKNRFKRADFLKQNFSETTMQTAYALPAPPPPLDWRIAIEDFVMASGQPDFVRLAESLARTCFKIEKHEPPLYCATFKGREVLRPPRLAEEDLLATALVHCLRDAHRAMRVACREFNMPKSERHDFLQRLLLSDNVSVEIGDAKLPFHQAVSEAARKLLCRNSHADPYLQNNPAPPTRIIFRRSPRSICGGG